MNQSTSKVQDHERGVRILEERERLGHTQTGFAALGGVKKGSQILYEKGNAPTADYLAAIGNHGADLVYILTGLRAQDIVPRVGTKVRRMDGTVIATYDGSRTREEESSPAIRELDHAGFILLPMYDGVHASAGAGVMPTSEHANAVLAFERQFLRDRGAIPDSCTVIKARGDGMTPTIPDGSLLVVDHSQREVANGYITVIGVGDDLLVKRIRRRLDGMVELISDNAAYAPEVIAADRLEQLRIVGRVIYFCRTP